MPVNVDAIKRLIALEERLQGVPEGLGLAVAMQESELNPNARGDGGKSLGLFQMQEAAAKDAGIDPARRHEVPLNVEGGIRYLKLKLDQSGGNIDQALSRYNRGTPDYRGIGDPNYVQHVRRYYQPQPQPQPQQSPSLLARVGNALSPASAEASTMPTTDLEAKRRRLAELEAELARRDAQQVPGATTTPAPVSQAAPTPAPPGAPPGGTPAPSAADEQYAAQTIARMRQNQPRTVETDPAALLAVGGGPTTPQPAPPPVTDPAALLASGGAGAPRPQTREQQILAEAEARRQRGEVPAGPGPPGGVVQPRPPDDQPLEEGITKPSTMIPLVAGLGTARVALTPLSRLLLEPVAQTVGEEGGRWWETGKPPTPQQALETFAWNLVPSAAEETLRAGGRGVLRRGTGGQMILKDQAAKDAQGLGVRVMQAPEREALSETFDEIARTGVKLDMAPVRSYWGTLAGGERQRALAEVRRISSPLADVLDKTGGAGLKGWDIGDLQHLRSELIKRRQAVSTPETKDLLSDLRNAVDDAIENGIAVGKVPAGFAPERLKEAQVGWRKMRMADDLQGIVTKHTSFNPNTQYSDLNLAALNKELQGTTKRSQRLLSQMDEGQREALKAEIKELSRNYPFLKIPSLAHIVTTGGSLTTAGIMAMTGQPGPAVAAAIPAALSLALQSPKAMSLFKEAILRDRGELKPNTIALIIDTARRELGYGAQDSPNAAASGATR